MVFMPFVLMTWRKLSALRQKVRYTKPESGSPRLNPGYKSMV